LTAAVGDAPRVPQRPIYLRIAWTLRDYAKRVWDNSGEDNIFFLAGGIAFNILLAIVPFVLLLVSGLATLLNHSADETVADITAIIDSLLPPHAETAGSPVHKLLLDVIGARGTVGVFSAIGFVWFSTRLFGSLRTVLADVFDIETERGIIQGKIFDIQITIVATLLLVAYTAISAYLALATTRGIEIFERLGIRADLMGRVEYGIGRLIAFAFVATMFFALYKFLPNRRIRWQTALLAAVFTSSMFEVAKSVVAAYVAEFNPRSLYTGTLYALVIVVFWVYYAAMIFILGGEVGQVYELRRVRRLQRETFED
jgi:membrane protein